ncbi:transposase [Pseudomonadota bacterium]
MKTGTPRNQLLSEYNQAMIQKRSRILACVEHKFGNQQNSMGGKFIRTIGLARANAKIVLMTLAYNMKRLEYLERQCDRNCAPIA